MVVALVVATCCFGVGDAQGTTPTGPVQGKCNATLAIKNCALDPKVAPAGRQGWPAGLLADVSKPMYGVNEDYTLFTDHLAYMIHQIFRDADMKEPHIYTSSSPGECYFPLLYYTCSSAYHECMADKNTTIRVERQVFPPPAPPGGTPSGTVLPTVEVVLESLNVPRYPCVAFCEDPQVRACKDKLVTAINASLAGLPTLPQYLSNLTDWFNCTKLGQKSKYSRNNAGTVCLHRPPAPAPPSSPPPPYSPPMPPQPPVSPAGMAVFRTGTMGTAMAAALVVLTFTLAGRGT